MKLTIPSELQGPFDMLIKSVPPEIQENSGFKETTLVYLKLGGINLARHYVETTKKFFNYDPLEVGKGLRFPKVVEAKLEQAETKDDSYDESDEDENEDDEAEES